MILLGVLVQSRERYVYFQLDPFFSSPPFNMFSVEIVDFLRDRTRYVAIGAKLPKGILLSGTSLLTEKIK